MDVSLESQIVIDRNPVEGNGGCNQSETHEGHGAEQDATTANAVNEHEIDPGEEEVDCGNDSTNGHGVGESDESENSRRVVHKRIETSELRDGHETTSRDESTEVGGHDVELLESPPLALAAGEFHRLLDVHADVLHLLLDLKLGSIGKDLRNDPGGLLWVSMKDQMTRRFGAERKEAAENDGRDSTTADHVAPSPVDVSEACSNSIGDELTTSDAHVVKTDHAAAVSSGRNFGDVLIERVSRLYVM